MRTKTNNNAIDPAISHLLANPDITLAGMQNGDENGNIDANVLILLVGLIKIAKYPK